MIVRLKGNFSSYIFDPENEKTTLRKNGRFSLVYLGKDENTAQTVIIKQLHPRLIGKQQEAERFRSEYRPDFRLNGFSHTIDFIEADHQLYLIRNFIEGEDFSTESRKKWIRKCSVAERRNILFEMLSRVNDLHEAGIIHGDLKPSNFIIGPHNQISLIDLGTGIASDPSQRAAKNEQHPLPFAFRYSAPELMLNEVDLIDARSDLFSLGVLWFELLSGKAAWEDANPAVLMNLQMVYPLVNNGSISKNLFELLEKMTARYSFRIPPNRISADERRKGLIAGLEKRFSSASEVRDALENLYSDDFKLKSVFWNLF